VLCSYAGDEGKENVHSGARVGGMRPIPRNTEEVECLLELQRGRDVREALFREVIWTAGPEGMQLDERQRGRRFERKSVMVDL